MTTSKRNKIIQDLLDMIKTFYASRHKINVENMLDISVGVALFWYVLIASSILIS